MDWQQVLAAIEAMSVVEEAAFGRTVLAQLEPLIPFDLASYNEIDPHEGRAVFCVHPPEPHSEEVAEEFGRYAYQHPALQHHLRTGDGSAKRISDFLSPAEFHALDLYRHIYRPRGVEYQVSIALPCPRPTVIGIALDRTRRDFDDDECRLLDTLRPHLVQAHRNATLLSLRRHALENLTGVFEDEGMYVLLLDRDRLAEPTSQVATRLLDAYFGTSVHGGSLPDAVATWVASERDALATGGPTRVREPLVGHQPGRRLVARFVAGGPTGPDVVVLTEGPEERDTARLESLGLTPREAEVLSAVTKGMTNEAIARRLEISAATVKKHLERVYRKLGVETRTAAAAQAFEVLTTRPPR